MRPFSEYADRLYLGADGPAHVVPWGDDTALCGARDDHGPWYGNGDWEETELAASLHLCSDCADTAAPDHDPAVDEWRQALNNHH